MTDRKVKRLTPNSIANLVMADEAWHDSLYVKAEDYDSLLADFEALRTALASPRLEVTVDPRLTAEEAAAISAAIDARKKEQSEDIEALRRDAERYKWVLNWLWRYGLLSREKTRIDTPESYGDWFVLRKPRIIDGGSLIGYGKTEDAAIDAAMKEGT